MIKGKKTDQSFEDGEVSIYSVHNGAAAGNKPSVALAFKCLLRYSERIVGINRYYKAAQENARVEMVLRCHRLREVSTQDVAIVNGVQYKINQVQYPQDVSPQCMDLSLSRVEQEYGIAR